MNEKNPQLTSLQSTQVVPRVSPKPIGLEPLGIQLISPIGLGLTLGTFLDVVTKRVPKCARC